MKNDLPTIAIWLRTTILLFVIGITIGEIKVTLNDISNSSNTFVISINQDIKIVAITLTIILLLFWIPLEIINHLKLGTIRFLKAKIRTIIK